MKINELINHQGKVYPILTAALKEVNNAKREIRLSKITESLSKKGITKRQCRASQALRVLVSAGAIAFGDREGEYKKVGKYNTEEYRRVPKYKRKNEITIYCVLQ